MTEKEFDELLKQVLLQYIKQEEENANNEIDEEIKFSKRHERKMKKIFRKSRKLERRKEV